MMTKMLLMCSSNTDQHECNSAVITKDVVDVQCLCNSSVIPNMLLTYSAKIYGTERKPKCWDGGVSLNLLVNEQYLA